METRENHARIINASHSLLGSSLNHKCPLPLFKSAAHQTAFESKGVLKIDFLPEELCEQLLGVYRKHHYKGLLASASGFYTGDSEQEALRRLHSEAIVRACMPFLSHYLRPYQVIQACYVVKVPDPKGITPIHQDWTFVDEQRYASCTLWCALHEVKVSQGALCVLAGSHLHVRDSRPSPSPPYIPPFAQAIPRIFPRMKPYPLRRGEALIFNHRTLHGALPNLSPQPRIAIGISLTHKEAPLCHHHLLPDRRHAAIFAVKPHFFLKYTHQILRKIHETRQSISEYPIQNQYHYRQNPYPKTLDALIEKQPINATIKKTLQKVFEQTPSDTKSASASPKSKSLVSKKRSFWRVYTPSNIYAELRHRFEPVRLILKRSCIKRQHVAQLYNHQHKAFQDIYGDVIQAFRTKPIEILLDYELKSIGITDGDYVLDAGCGVGGPALYFAKHKLCRIEAMTLSDMQYYAARAKAKAQQQDNVQFHLGDYHEADAVFEHECFDKVFFLESMGHSYDLTRLFNTLWNILKPQGILYIKDLFHKYAPIPLPQTRIEQELRRIKAHYHYDVLRMETLLRIAQRKGFILRRIQSVDIPVKHFEGLSISNEFQERTGLCLIKSWDDYVFPVDFLEVVFQKSSASAHLYKDQHFMQRLQRANPSRRCASHLDNGS